MSSTLLISGKSRPFGILSNGVLPFRKGKDYYPSVDHFMMASMLARPSDKANLLSYPDLYHAKIVYNQLDQAQYQKVLEDSCLQWYKKLCRETSLEEGKALGSRLRTLLKDTVSFSYEPDQPSPLGMMLGSYEKRGYNLIGQVLGTLHQTLKDTTDDVPVGLEYLFWKLDGKKTDQNRVFRMVGKGELNPVLREEKTQKVLTNVAKDLLEEEDDMNAEVFDDGEGEVSGGTGEVVDFLEDVQEPPSLSFKERRQIPGRQYFTEGSSKDILDTEDEGLEKRTNPMEVFKMMKVAEYLSNLMKGGIDIVSFMDKTVQQIFHDYNIFPEVMALSPETKRYIYKDCWDMFRAKTIPFYDLIRTEVLYPSTTMNNMVGELRKQKIKDLNMNVGFRIQQILFRCFLEQIVKRNYPDLDDSLLPLTVHRESLRFSADEFQNITNHLYHLFFKGSFKVEERDAVMIQFYESQRKPQEVIDDALRYVPFLSGPGLQVRGHPLLDPMRPRRLRLHNKEFRDLFQYIYYQLFQFFGGVSPEKAYQELHHNHQLLSGDSPLLPERLHFLVQARRQELLDEALSLKWQAYPQIREILVYLKTTNQPFRFEDPLDMDTTRGWMVQMEKVPVRDQELMKVVITWVKRDFSKSVFLYSFLKEFFGVLHLYRSLKGSKVSGETLITFLSCFFKNLVILQTYFNRSIPDCPMPFHSWIEQGKDVGPKDIGVLWSYLYPYIYHFTLESFQPSKEFQKAKEQTANLDETQKEIRIVKAFVKLANCALAQDKPFETPELYLLAQIFSGKLRLTPWRDPTFEYVVEEEKDNAPPLAHLLPKEIREKIPMGRKKVEKRVYRQDLIHPATQHLLPLIKEELGRDTFKEDFSQLSFAIASVIRHTTNPRRIQFFLV